MPPDESDAKSMMSEHPGAGAEHGKPEEPRKLSISSTATTGIRKDSKPQPVESQLQIAKPHPVESQLQIAKPHPVESQLQIAKPHPVESQLQIGKPGEHPRRHSNFSKATTGTRKDSKPHPVESQLHISKPGDTRKHSNSSAGTGTRKNSKSHPNNSQLTLHSGEDEDEGEDEEEHEGTEEGPDEADAPDHIKHDKQHRLSDFSIFDKPLELLAKPRNSLIDGPLAYEWESAKSKPHARIISRKYPKPTDAQRAPMQNTYGLSRFGKLNAPKALVIGRTLDPTEPKPDDRPNAYSGPDETGKYKPNALVLSRRKGFKLGGHGVRFQNIYGLTRFGKASSPNAVMMSRVEVKDKRQPGPGAYDPYDTRDTRVGILIKGRLKSWEHRSPQPGANAYDLPTEMGEGPAFSFAGRYMDEIQSQSPGPIYSLPDLRKKALSLTFKPFPWRKQKEYPGPNEYANLPGDQKIDWALPRRPVVRFAGKPYDPNEEYGTNPVDTGPGPGDFDLSGYKGTTYGKPKAVIISRPKFTPETCGSGKLENLFGKSRFGSKYVSKGIICSRHYAKDKSLPGPGAYDPYLIKDTRVGISIKSRWNEGPNSRNTGQIGSTGPGPGDYDIKSTMGNGPAYSLVPKFRGQLGILEKVPKMKDYTSCRENITEKKSTERCAQPETPKCPPSWLDGFVIDPCIQ